MQVLARIHRRVYVFVTLTALLALVASFGGSWWSSGESSGVAYAQCGATAPGGERRTPDTRTSRDRADAQPAMGKVSARRSWSAPP